MTALIQRYDSSDATRMSADPEGHWVTYADHAAEVAALTASNNYLALAGQRNAQRLVAAEAELARVRERLAEAGDR